MEIGVGEDSPSEEEFRFQTIGEQLKAERERQGLSLSDMAAKTRVPMRHLDAIEKSEFSSLPGTTYTLGFARSFARALDMDAAKVSTDLRAELATGGHEGYQAPTQNYEPADPSRVPSKTLAWTAAAIAVLVVAGYFFWRSMMLDSALPVLDAVDVPVAAQNKTGEATPAATVTDAVGNVILTATDSVWVKVYDADNKPLFESEMKAGDRYNVPPDANGPMIVTGRPNAIAITVGGKSVPALGEAERTVVDVGISAAALLARNTNGTAGTSDNPAVGGSAQATPKSGTQ